MAAADKNIVITPERGSASALPRIAFTGLGNDPITLYAADGTPGSLSFEGSVGRLLSITNSPSTGSVLDVNGTALFSGKVGIGTTGPLYPLHVEKSQEDLLALVNTGVVTYRFQAKTDASLAIVQNATERVRIDGVGNVGIGITNPSVKLEVNNGGTALSASGGTLIRSVGSGVSRVDIVSGNTSFSILEFSRANLTAAGQIAYDHTNNALSFTLNGALEKMRIDSSGNIGVSDSSPSTNSIGAGAPTMVLRGTSGAQPTRSAGLCFISQDGTSKTLQYHDNNIFYTQSTAATAQVWFTNNLERMRIDSSGRLLVGTSAATGVQHFAIGNTYDVDPKSQFNTLGVSCAQLLRTDFPSNETGSLLALAKSRGSTVNSNTIVANGDTLGGIGFFGADGTDIRSWGASIYCLVDGTPGVNDMPGRLVFSTTADGAAIPTERMRIDSSGRVGIGTSSFAAANHKLTVSGGYSVLNGLRISGADTANSIYQAGAFGLSSDNYITIGTGASQTERLRIDATGNVGIGTTDPLALLMVSGTQTTASGLVSTVGPAFIYNSTNNADTTAVQTVLSLHRVGKSSVSYGNQVNFNLGRYSQSGTAAQTQLDIRLTSGNTNNPDTDVMTLLASGRVGIGTTSPTTILDVIGSGNPTITLRGSDGAYTGILNIQAAGAGSSVINATGGSIALNLQTNGTNRVTIDSSGNSTFAGQVISTRANSTADGAGQIYLNGATGNRIDFNQSGVAAPTTTTRSAGTKIVLFPNISATQVDYALGIDGSTFWSSVESSSASFKWYAGTTNIATLSGAGNFSTTGTVLGSNITGYSIPDTGGAASYVLLGTWTTGQAGYTLYINVVSHSGFNASQAQNQVTRLYFKTSNGSSNQGGFYGDALAFTEYPLGYNTGSPASFRIVQVSTSSYAVYGSFSSYTSGSTYQLQYPSYTTWTHSGTLTAAPTGTFLDVTPTNYNSFSPTLTGTGASGSWGISVTGSAASLTTTRTLWGQNFNGTGNVTGSLTSVGDITGVGAVTLTATAGALGLVATGANSVTASTNGSTRLTIDSGGRLLVGTPSSRTGVATFVSGTNNTNADYQGSAGSFVGPGLVGTATNAATISVEDNREMTAGVGGSIGFGGRYLSANTSYAQWAAIAGEKSTGTSGEYGGYLAFYTRTHASASIDERMRIDSAGLVIIGPGTQNYFNGNQINAQYGNNGNAELAFNYVGYAGGTTQFRDTTIYNGKNGLVARFTGSTNVFSTVGQITSTQANSATTGAGQIYLNGATGNRIDFNTNGIAAPAFTTRSAGTKIVLYGGDFGAAAGDYAFGVESNNRWSSVPTTTQGFKWYAGTTNIATLSGAGVLSLATDGSTLYGPNTTWSRYLRVGGNGNADTTNASVVTTNGNLHLDAAAGASATFINYYKGTGGVNFGNGASGTIGSISSAGVLSVNSTITGTQLISNIATGTAPLAVTSTTQVTNLNSNYLNGITASGLFNNMGGSHGNRTDFNAITDFGFNYVAGTTNGPGISGAAQYYNLSIGLGSNFAYSQYAMEFAIPRTPVGGNPYPSVRFREGSSWGSWSKIYAGYADSAGSVTNSVTFNNGGAGAASGTTFNGSAAQTISYNTLGASPLAGSSSLTTTGTVTSGTWSGSFGAVSGANLTSLTAGNLSGTIPSAVLGNSTHYIGTTAIALNRASAAQALTGITSIDGSSASCTGNAATATALQTARSIGGTSFNGSADITPFRANTIPTIDETGVVKASATTYAARSASSTPQQYTYGVNWEFKNAAAVSGTGTYAGLLTLAPWLGTTASTGDPNYQLAFSPAAANSTAIPTIKVRAGIDATWGSWATLLNSSNYTTYAPTLTGTGASGSWGISVTGSSASCTGNAATATTATNVSGGTVSATTGSFSGNMSFDSGYGSAAVAYGCRAWVNFNGAGTGTFAGGASTVTRIAGSTTATITCTTAHGLLTGSVVYVNPPLTIAGTYTVTVTSTTQFTIVTAATTAISAVTITFSLALIRASGNVSSVTKTSTGQYAVNFISAMPDTNYAMVQSGSSTAQPAPIGLSWTAASTTSVANISQWYMTSTQNQTYIDGTYNSVAFFR